MMMVRGLDSMMVRGLDSMMVRGLDLNHISLPSIFTVSPY